MSETWNTVRLDGDVTPGQAAEFAERAVETASRVDGGDLDYSPRSLLAVDEIVASLRTEYYGAPPIHALLCLGCYTGEVIRRELGGAWASNHEGPWTGLIPAPLVLSMPRGGVLNPIGKVVKGFDNGEGDSVFALYHAIASMPPFGR